jgi:hypothetical protein
MGVKQADYVARRPQRGRPSQRNDPLNIVVDRRRVHRV